MDKASLSKDDLVKALLELNGEDYRTVLCTLAKENPYPEHTVYITNKFQQHRKKAKAEPVSTKQKVTTVELFKLPEQPKLKTGREGASSRALGSSPFASLLPDIPGASAWQCLQKENFFWTSDPDLDDICQYVTSVHRVTKAKILGGVELATVRDILEKCFKGNMVVGARLVDDLKSLSFENEFLEDKFFKHDKIYDLQSFYVDKMGQAINLKDLVAHFFPQKANSFQSGVHSSISDARMTMQLYLKMCELTKDDPNMENTADLNIKRTKKKFRYDPNDICKCNKK